MDNDPFEPFLLIIAALAGIIGQCCIKIVTQDMSSDNTRAQWNDDEKGALILFLLKQKCAGKMGNGAFKPAILNAAAAHLSQLFPNQRGPMKNAEHCKRQISSLKSMLRDINQWRSTLGVHWDNVNGAKVGTEEEKQVFKSWLQSHPTNSMCHFENCGWSHLEGMEELYLNNQVCGSHAYHPASQAIAVSDSAGNGGVSSRSLASTISSTSAPPLSYLHPNYPDTSSHTSTPSILFTLPPDATPASPTVFASSAPPSIMGPMQSSKKHSFAGAGANSSLCLGNPVSAQAALQTISLNDDEWFSKRAKKGKHESTQAALIGIQGSLSYLGSIVSSLLPAATLQMWTDKLHLALMTVEEWDKDLSIEAKSSLLEAFHVDMGMIDVYMMLHDRDLHRGWMQCCLQFQYCS
ncbi:hypothetical protein EDC04DRAFT_2904767 [Pisolithus marmoratus]|nr:hypothetical protein EDC04DRAFT_2904767 [Pisolithus marmoratus]